MKKGKVSIYHICFIAFAICLNYVGGQIALRLHLPIYLDSIGTLFTAIALGPIYGMLPNVLSGLLMGITGDVYSLYYAPVGILLGLSAGIVCKKYKPKKWWGILLAALMIFILPAILSSTITALLGGITSSGSSVLVQLLYKSPIGDLVGLVGSCFIVQFVTDYIDRAICLYLAFALIKAVPKRYWSDL